MTDLYSPMTMKRGPAMPNRFMLAPLTNLQSNKDGTLSDDEYKWLTMRAEGGFGLTMTCASHVQEVGLGFPGQLGCFDDKHLEGLARLAEGIGAHDSVSSVQLHHAGMRSPENFIGQKPVSASDDEETGARALSTGEVEQLAEDFIAAAERVEKAGFDGAELHGAHGYILCQFLSAETNRRDDQYGGSLENRTRLIRDIIAGIRARCSDNFQLGLRLSPERFGIDMGESLQFAEEVMLSGDIDYLDMSLWDTFKEPVDEGFKGKTLLDHFAGLKRGETRLGVAGKLRTPADIRNAMDAGLDFVLLGRAAIIHHDYPNLMKADPDFNPVRNPVPADHLRKEGLSETFLNYMKTWKGFVEEDE